MFDSTRRISPRAIFPAVLFFLWLGACTPESSAAAPSPREDPYRATPEAEQPAAGICASFKEETIRVEIRAWPDNVPEPRCIRVRAEQKMIIVNNAGEAIAFRLGRYQARIEPGGSFTIDIPFGDYLAPGAHSLHIQPYGGPEIFFEGE
jgi:hypothetical protein